MLLRGSEEHRGAKPMAASPKRSNPLHNFTLPFLKWGRQRKMRCAAAGGSDHRSSASNFSDESTATWNKGNCGGEEGIAVVRQKLILELKIEADQMKDAILRNEQQEPVVTLRPWNLRMRRAKVEAPGDGDGRKRVLKIDDNKKQNDLSSPAMLPQLRSVTDKTERVKFSWQLSKKEIEEDFIAILGHHPPRRPNKRPKHVQNRLDALLPGLWLTEVTADSYKVIGVTENVKVRRNGKKRKVDAAGF